MRPNPRALYVAFDVFPRAKGSSSHIASMVTALERSFATVRLLCLGTPDMPAVQVEGGIEIFRYTAQRRDLLQRATGFARFVGSHVRQLRGVLQLAVFRDPWGGYPLLRGAPGCPCIFEVNALPSWELAYSRPAAVSNAALWAKLGDMERRCLQYASRILCVSGVTRGALLANGVPGDKIEVIPNLAHDVFFDAARQDCPIPALEDGSWFGYVGGVQAWQGVEALVDAYALVAGELPAARLLILHGDTRQPLRELQRRLARRQLKQRVLLHAPLPVEGVAGVLARLRFSAVPLADTSRNTLQGCCPLKLVEAMAAGTPVIASDLAVCREWVRDGVEGLLAAPGDSRAWALSIRRLFGNEELRRRLGTAARRRAQQCFSRQAVHGRLLEVFEAAAGDWN